MQPRHPYTLGLLRSVPDADDVRESLDSIPGSPPDLVSPPPGCRFRSALRASPRTTASSETSSRCVALGDGRVSACIHSDECAAAVREQPVVADV